MKTLRSAPVYPDEILPPEHSGTLLEEVTRVAALQDRGLHPFGIAWRLWKPLRWVLDRIELRRFDPEILTRATPRMAKALLQRLREETAPILDLVRERSSQAPFLERSQREARVFASARVF